MNTRNHIRGLIAGFLGQPEALIDDAAPLVELVTDSFALVELVVHLQEETDVLIEREAFEAVASVGDLIDLFCAAGVPREGS